ncbi:MAG: DUF4197 domain-containing protein [Tunicatimonas sp.]
MKRVPHSYFSARRCLLLLPIVLLTSCDVLQGVLNSAGSGGLTSAEIVRGLKTALKKGAKYAGDNASQENGYLNNPVVDIRIPLPDKLQRVERNVRKIPLVGDRVVDNFITSMNRGAEQAAKKAAPIFVDAITSMTVSDGLGILQGGDEAATNYLERATTASLTSAFRPIIKSALDQTKATDYYNALKNAISTFNRTPLVSKINVNVGELPVLEDYATEMALNGLFKLVAREEKKIRDDPFGQSEQILRKVFGSQKSTATPTGIGG